jgi:hypothetical protein
MKTDTWSEAHEPSDYFIDGKRVERLGSFNSKVINATNKKVGKKQRNVTGIYDKVENKFYIYIKL